MTWHGISPSINFFSNLKTCQVSILSRVNVCELNCVSQSKVRRKLTISLSIGFLSHSKIPGELRPARPFEIFYLVPQKVYYLLKNFVNLNFLPSNDTYTIGHTKVTNSHYVDLSYKYKNKEPLFYGMCSIMIKKIILTSTLPVFYVLI